MLNRQAFGVPASLHRWVSAVIGLSNVHLPGSALTSGPCSRAPGLPRGPRHPAVYTAAWLAHAYQFNPLYRHHDFGHRVTVGCSSWPTTPARDIRAYTRCYGVTRDQAGAGRRRHHGQGLGQAVRRRSPRTSRRSPGWPRGRASWSTRHPWQPGNQSIVDNYGALAAARPRPGHQQFLGFCEPLLLAGHRGLIEAEAGIFAGMALQGQSMLAASGDSGSEACLPFLQDLPARAAYRLAVGDPASQPYVTASAGPPSSGTARLPVQSAWNQTARAAARGFVPPSTAGMAARPSTRATWQAAAGSPGLADAALAARLRASGNSSGCRAARSRAGHAVRFPTSPRWRPTRRQAVPLATPSTARPGRSTAPGG